MKYIKTYEETERPWDYLKGHYVIVRYSDPYGSYDKTRRSEFFENNIGKIVKVYYPGAYVNVKYEDPPKYMKGFLDAKGDDFHTSDIILHSENKEDLEYYIAAKRYNL